MRDNDLSQVVLNTLQFPEEELIEQAYNNIKKTLTDIEMPHWIMLLLLDKVKAELLSEAYNSYVSTTIMEKNSLMHEAHARQACREENFECQSAEEPSIQAI